MGWTNQQTDSLTLPPGAVGAPRIFLGSGDPLATAAGALAALMFYWETDEAFMLWVNGTPPSGMIQLANTDATGIVAQYFTGTYNESTGFAEMILGGVDTDQVDIDTSDFTIDDVSQGRNNRTEAGINANSGAIGAETVVLTIPSATYKSGRAFEVKVGGRFQASVANTATFRLRFGTTTAGTLVATLGGVSAQTAGATTAPNISLSRYLIRDAGDPDLTTAMCVTMAASAGTATLLGAANEPSYVEINDVGFWSDFTTQGIFL